ncbi:MAG: hypothetical protein NVS1B11_11510 [Terriglobales bacterium]
MVRPETVALHLAKIETSDASWLVRVDRVIEDSGDDNLRLDLELEQITEAEKRQTPKVRVRAFGPDIEDPLLRPKVLGSIRQWIDMTEGDEVDGYLDLV